MDSNTQGFFGFQDIVSLPDNVELRFNEGQIVKDSQMYDTTGQIDIVDTETGLTIGYIAAPESTDSSLEVDEDIKQGMSKEVMLTQSEPGTQYFFTLEGSELLITTVVNIDWLLSDYTTFPVVIIICRYKQVDTGTPGTYELWKCQPKIATVPPETDFILTGLAMVEIANGRQDSISRLLNNSSKCGKCKCCLRIRLPILCDDGDEIAGLLIMEECGNYDPTSAGTNLNSLHYPAECTGTPLSAYTPPPPPPPAPVVVEHEFSSFDYFSECSAYNDVYGSASTPIPSRCCSISILHHIRHG